MLGFGAIGFILGFSLVTVALLGVLGLVLGIFLPFLFGGRPGGGSGPGGFWTGGGYGGGGGFSSGGDSFGGGGGDFGGGGASGDW